MVAAYAFNTNDQRKSLWRFMDQICQNISSPLIIGGDFNTFLRAEDRFQGNPVCEADIKDFAECMQLNELTTIRMVGHDYSWCNNQQGDDRILSLIDRTVANPNWFRVYADVVELMEKGIYDHCPQLISTELENSGKKPPFMFLNVLTEHKDFTQILKETWELHCHDKKLLNIWYRLKHLKQPLKQLNVAHFKHLTDKINGLRQSLKHTHQQLSLDKMNDMLITEERQLLKELEKWSNIEERIWHQKSRVDWLKLGDANTKFFHAYTKARSSGNAIKVLIKSDGTRCYTQQQIQEGIKEFYQNLMGSAAHSLPMVDKRIIKKRACTGLRTPTISLLSLYNIGDHKCFVKYESS